jgi:predicted DNA-binding transcriptional regulator AlpA
VTHPEVAMFPPLIPAASVIPKKLTLKEVAEWLSCSTATLTRIVRTDPDFPAPIRVGKALIRFDRDELNRYLETKRTREPIEGRAKKPEPKTRAKRKK